MSKFLNSSLTFFKFFIIKSIFTSVVAGDALYFIHKNYYFYNNLSNYKFIILKIISNKLF